MHPTASAALKEFLETKAQFLSTFERVPDDRVTWSPSPTARSPLELLTHVTMSLDFLFQQLQGKAFEIPTTAEADAMFRHAESAVKDRALALRLFERRCGAFERWLESLDEATFDGHMILPFRMGEAPLSTAIGFPALHTRWHLAQLEYLQTIYGDRNWGM